MVMQLNRPSSKSHQLIGVSACQLHLLTIGVSLAFRNWVSVSIRLESQSRVLRLCWQRSRSQRQVLQAWTCRFTSLCDLGPKESLGKCAQGQAKRSDEPVLA